jgi:plastocyanin domain-containing protein
MGNEIEISRTTGLLLAGLFFAIIIGGFVVFGAGARAPGAGTEAATYAGQPQGGGQAAAGAQVQDIYIKALGTGAYDNPQVTVRKGIPVKLHFSAEASAGCGRALYLDGFNVQLVSRSGEEQMAEFTPEKEGTYAYHCGMNMFRGRMVVTS